RVSPIARSLLPAPRRGGSHEPAGAARGWLSSTTGCRRVSACSPSVMVKVMLHLPWSLAAVASGHGKSCRVGSGGRGRLPAAAWRLDVGARCRQKSRAVWSLSCVGHGFIPHAPAVLARPAVQQGTQRRQKTGLEFTEMVIVVIALQGPPAQPFS